jgi:hypothetical protein
MRCLSFLPEGPMHFRSVIDLIRHCPGLQTFSYQYVGEYDIEDEDNFLPALARHCPKLQILRYDIHSGCGGDFKQLVLSCFDLHTVDMGHTGDEQTLKSVLTHCKKLRALRTGYLEDAVVPLLQARLPQLEHLSLKYVQCTAASLLALAEHCGSLRSLALELSEEYASPLTSMSGTMSLFLAKLVAVEMLDLSRARWLTADSLITIATHCKRLRCFALDSTKRAITASAISALIKGCPLLRKIVHGMFDDVLSVEANRAVWHRQRPGLTVTHTYPSSEYWHSLVYGSACVLE